MKAKIMMAALVITLFSACGKKESEPNVSSSKPETPKTIIAKKEILVDGSKLRFPAGTKITPSADGYELTVELPEGYFPLTKGDPASPALTANRFPIFTVSYRCQCSASNGTACQVFYQEEAGGFGCFHKNCGGSCTGSFTINGVPVEAVLNKDNAEVTVRKDVVVQPASYTETGIETFFDQPSVQQKVAEQYAMLYKNAAMPDFKSLEANPKTPGYVYVKAKLYGVSFYMLAPKGSSDLSRYADVVASEHASCKCTQGSGCKLHQRGFLGWDVFWCEEDCNACNLTVDVPKKTID